MKKSQKKLLESGLRKLYDSGISINDALDFNLKEWNKNFHKGKRIIKSNASLKGQKRRLQQVSINQETILDYYVKKHEITNKKRIKFIKKNVKELFDLKEKEGIYTIRKVKVGKEIYWIKSTSISDYNKQLNKIRRSYHLKKAKIRVLFKKSRKYTEFINLEKFEIFVNATI